MRARVVNVDHISVRVSDFARSDGLKLEGMKWGEKTEQAKRKRDAAKKAKAKPKVRAKAG